MQADASLLRQSQENMLSKLEGDRFNFDNIQHLVKKFKENRKILEINWVHFCFRGAMDRQLIRNWKMKAYQRMKMKGVI